MSDPAFTVDLNAAITLLKGDDQFTRPWSIIGDLKEAQALAKAAPYSLAQIVRHMDYWQTKRFGKLLGRRIKIVKTIDETFELPENFDWRIQKTAFLTDLKALVAMAEQRAADTDSQPESSRFGYGLACTALHNAYHLGQISIIRQQLGIWPPRPARL